MNSSFHLYKRRTGKDTHCNTLSLNVKAITKHCVVKLVIKHVALFFFYFIGRKRPREHSAAYMRDEKRRKSSKTTSKDTTESQPYDVDAHISHLPEPEAWIQELGLSKHEEEILMNGMWLNDTLIDAGQKLLKIQFGQKIQGLQDLCLTQTLALDVCTGELVQILNKDAAHWFTISTIGCQQPATVRVYDSASKYVTFRNQEEIASLLFTPTSSITLQYMNAHMQMGGSDCGLFALATATALCYGVDPTTCVYDQESMRQHFHACLTNRKITLFPLKRNRRPHPQPLKEETYPVYCHCRLPWDKHHTEDGMTMCDGCKDWFHETCDKPNCSSQSQWMCKNCKK